MYNREKIKKFKTFQPRDIIPQQSQNELIQILDYEQSQSQDCNIESKSKTESKKQIEINFLKQIGLLQKHSMHQQIMKVSFVDDIKEKTELKKFINQLQEQYRSHYQQIESSKKRQHYLAAIQMENIQILQQQIVNSNFLSKFLQSILLSKEYCSIICRKISSHFLFQSLNLTVILINSLVMATSDPLEMQPTQLQNIFQIIFLSWYIFQMVIFIIGYGFIFPENSYLRNPWNILNIVIIISSILPYFINLGFSVNSLKIIRIFRPLRTITKIKALKMIIKTLFESFSLVTDSVIILLFTILIFSVVGLQIFSGCLKKRCIDITTGIIKNLCVNDQSCINYGQNYFCAKTISSPNFSIQNFDTIGWAFISVFQTITLEGWATIMIDLQNSFHFASLIYSISIILVCEMILLNITLAILKYKFSQIKTNKLEINEQKTIQQISIAQLKQLSIYSQMSKVKSCIFNHTQFGKSQNTNYHKNQKFPVIRKRISKPKTTKITLDKFKQIDKQQPKKNNIQIMNQITQSQRERFSYNSDVQVNDYVIIQQKKQYPLNEIIYQQQRKAQHIIQSSSQNNCNYEYINTQNLITEERKIIEEDEDDYEKNIIEKNKFLLYLTEEYHNINAQNNNGKQVILFQRPEFDLIPNQKFFQEIKHQGSLKLTESKTNLKKIKIKQKEYKPRQKKKLKSFKQIMKEQQNEKIRQIKIINQISKRKFKLQLKQLDQNSQLQQLSNRIINHLKYERKNSMKDKINLQSSKIQYEYYEDYFTYRQVNKLKEKIKIPEMSTRKIKSNKIICEYFIQKSSPNQKEIRINRFKIRFRQNNKKTVKNEQNNNEIEINKQYFQIFEECNKKQNIIQNPKSQYNSFHQNIKFESFVADQYLKNSQIYTNLINISQNFNSSIRMNFPSHQIFLFKQYNIQMIPLNYDIWILGITGMFTIIKSKIKILLSMNSYENFVLLIVVLNTIILSSNGIIDTSTYHLDYISILNQIFTILFTIDIGLKFIAFGFYFFEDSLNIFDLVIVIISLIELSMNNKIASNISAFKAIRIFRTFRVLRITRLLRSMKFINVITTVIYGVFQQFIYIFLFLFLFIFIYILLGMQFFAGTFLPYGITGIRQNFDNFFNASMSVFQILTVENWNDIQTQILASNNPKYFVLYLVSWIFLGNWVLLNLLQAILIDGFEVSAEQYKNMDQYTEYNQQETCFSSRNQQKQISTKYELSQYHQLKKQKQFSLLFFPHENLIRKVCIKISQNKYYEFFSQIVVLFSCSILVYNTYCQSIDEIKIYNVMNDITIYLFILQFLILIISKGFIFGQNAYLSNNWNKLDFIIILVSLLDIFISADLSFIKILRAIRPIRLISKNLKIKIIIASLFQSINGVANVSLVLFLVFMMFGILFINLLQGKLNYCDQGIGLVYGPFNINQSTCQTMGFVWRTQIVNFQNIYNALLSLYIFSTRQNWPFYYYTFVDSDENGPIENNNPILYLALCVIFILLCSYFLVDLFIGVLFINYHSAQKKINVRILTQKQKNWIELQKLIIKTDPLLILYQEPQNYFKKIIFKLTNHRYFQIFYGIVVILNILIFMCYQDDDPSSKTFILDSFRYLFCILFSAEFILKFISFNFRGYFISAWNIFDFFILITSILDIFINQEGLSTFIEIAKLLRVARILRLVKLFKKFENLEKLLQTVVYTIPGTLNALVLLLIFLFISSIIASFLFANIKQDTTLFLDKNHNFYDFHHSLELLFICLTGENWYVYMYATLTQSTTCTTTQKCTSPYYILFWLPFIFIGQKIIMQLFVLIVLDQFQQTYIEGNNPLGMYLAIQQDFRNKWLLYCKKGDSSYLEPKNAVPLLLHLKSPIGIGLQQGLQDLNKQLEKSNMSQQEKIRKRFQFISKLKKLSMKWIMKLNLPHKDLNYQYLFYKFAKQTITSQFEFINENQNEIMTEQDQISQKKLLKFQKDQKQKDIQELNPLLLHIFTKIALRTWINYSQKKNINKSDQNSVITTIDQKQMIELFEIKQKDNNDKKNQNQKTRISLLKSISLNQPQFFLPNTDLYSNDNFK